MFTAHKVPRGTRIFQDLFQNLTYTILLGVGNVPVSGESSIVISSTLRSADSFLIRLWLRVCTPRCEGACIYMCMHLYCVLKTYVYIEILFNKFITLLQKLINSDLFLEALMRAQKIIASVNTKH